ncbi:methionine--tRNA ligase [Halobacterium noricense]|uniref:Methionine--tRNA ligase n=1 Tax=Haladaptatus pallidirubidus TaxID=1008152 RepID=A0AAV3UQZ0_9EURY
MSHEPFPTETPAVVTCGLPYANGNIHLGHLRTYVGGDVLARALRTLGQQTAFVSGSDMHGTPIAVNAQQEGISPETFALRWHETYQTTFPRFHIEFDNYGHTHDEVNTALTREIVRDLDARGYIYETEIDVAWDAELDQPLLDRYIEGTCPYCGATARGDECENCGRHLEPGELEQPHSILTDNPATYRTRQHKFFRLTEFEDYLREFIDRLEGTSNAKNQPREWIEHELKDWNITRDLDWGIDYPSDGNDDLVLYVWVDAPIEYIASTKQYSDRVGTATFDWEQAWKQGDGELIHVIGRDIIQHHTVFWPAMLHGVDYTEPRAVMASGFMTLDGEAFSTSRQYAVWVDDYLDAGLDPDLYRYYITTGTGFQQDLNFSWEHFQERVNDELIGTVGNFCYRTLLFAARNYGGTPDEALGIEIRDRIEEACSEFQDGINAYSTREAMNAGIRLARFGNQYLQRHEPWTLTDSDPERAMQVIRGCVQLVKAIAILLEPVMPEKSAQLWEQLGETNSVHTATLDTVLEPPSSEFGELNELFEPISDDRIAALNEQLRAQRTEK